MKYRYHQAHLLSLTHSGEVNHGQKKQKQTNIALGLFCRICFGFELFCILGKVRHAEKQTLKLDCVAAIVLVLDCFQSTWVR